MNALIEIDTLALDGLTPDEGRRAARAFEDMLAGLLNQHGLPEGKTVEDITQIDLGELPRTMNTPEGLGQELARALFGELWL